MKITITLDCADVAEAATVMAALAGLNQVSGRATRSPTVAHETHTPATAPTATAAPAPVPPMMPPAAPAPAPAMSAPPAPAPVRPSTPSAPVANAAPAPTSTAEPAPAGLDASGIPWDSRIHSANGKKNGDGTWRRRRGVDDATFNQIEASLKAAAPPAPAMPAATAAEPPLPLTPPPAPAMSAPPPMPAATAPPAPPMPPAATLEPVIGQPFNLNGPVPVAPVGEAPASQIDFPSFMRHLGSRMQAVDANGQQILNGDYMAGLCQRVSARIGKSLGVITEVGQHPGAVDVAVGMMLADGKWQ